MYTLDADDFTQLISQEGLSRIISNVELRERDKCVKVFMKEAEGLVATALGIRSDYPVETQHQYPQLVNILKALEQSLYRKLA